MNKIDRAGATYDEVLRDIATRLTPDVVAMGEVTDLGTRAAAFTPYHAADDERSRSARRPADRARRRVPRGLRRRRVAGRRRRGCAASSPRRPGGRGPPGALRVRDDRAPASTTCCRRSRAAAGDHRRRRKPLSATVFKVERGPAGERVALCGCTPGRCGCATGSGSGAASRRPSPGSGSSTRRDVVRRSSVPAGRIAESWASASCRSATCWGSRGGAGRRPPLPAAHVGDRRRRRAGPSSAARCTPRWPSSPSRTR